jgi:hypothetical protein
VTSDKPHFIVHQRGRIVATFANHEDAWLWAGQRSFDRNCRCTVSKEQRVLEVYEDSGVVEMAWD